MHELVQVDFIVRRKTGGPMMLVTAISAEGPRAGHSACCEWHDDGALASAVVLLDELLSLTRI